MPKIRELGRERFELTQAFYTTKDLAHLLGVSKDFLKKLRMGGLGPRYIKAGHRTCKYPAHEVEKFLADRLVSSTSETPKYKLERERRPS